MKNQVICSVCEKSVSNTPIAQTMLSDEKVYDLLFCGNCSTTFFAPMPSKEALEHHYSNDYTFYKGDNFKAQGRGVAFAKKYLQHKKEGNLLDIGCASGDVLAGIQQGSDWNVFGTDINPEVVGSVRSKLSLDVRLGEIEDVGFDESFFDVVRVQDILEHVTQPVQFLKECRRIIDNNGSLYLSVPNGLADMQNLIDYYKRFDKPAFSGAGHIYFFPFEALSFMFEEAGFRIEKTYSCHFKKGLRSLSMLPKSKHWQRDLTPPIYQEPKAKQVNVVSCGQKKRSQLYYQFQFWKDELAELPGVHRYAQDFVFVLRPRL